MLPFRRQIIDQCLLATDEVPITTHFTGGGGFAANWLCMIRATETIRPVESHDVVADGAAVMYQLTPVLWVGQQEGSWAQAVDIRSKSKYLVHNMK